MTEAEIRADEREKCILELEAQATKYVETWARPIGEDHAKADAFNILVAARRLRKSEPTSGSTQPEKADG